MILGDEEVSSSEAAYTRFLLLCQGIVTLIGTYVM